MLYMKNGFGIKMRSMITTVKYKKNWWIFHVFKKWREIAQLGDVIEERGIKDAVKCIDFCNLHI